MKTTKLRRIRQINKSALVIFVILLTFLVLQSIFSWSFLRSYQTYLIITTIIFGALTFWLNRGKIDLEAETKREELEETKRKKESGEKFPRINRISGIRWFVRWMYTEGWVYSVGLVLLIAIGLGLRLWNLEVSSFGDDELITAYVAKGFADSGNFILPSGFTYNNYWLDILFRAFSIELFGFNEFGARLPSIIFGSLTIGLAYLVGRELGGKKVGLISAFIICFLPWEVSWSREARMYAPFQLFYLGLVYTTYLALVKYRKVGWYILSLILFMATFATHQLGIVFIAVPYCWVMLNFWQKRQVKEFLAMFFAALVLFVLFLLFYERLPISLSIVIEPFPRMGFLDFLFNYYTLLSAIGALGMFCLFLIKNKLGIFITISFIIPLVILSCFFGPQYGKYIYFLFPLVVITGSFALVHLWRLFIPMFRARKHAKALPIFILAILIFALIPFRHTFQIPQREVIDRAEITVFDSMTHPDWKGLAREVSHLIEEDTIVITTHPLASLYYFGECTYALRREEAILSLQFLYQDDQGRYREPQTGSISVMDYAEFISVIQNSDAFLIVDHRFSGHYVTEDVVDYVTENGTLIGSKGELKIYFLARTTGG